MPRWPVRGGLAVEPGFSQRTQPNRENRPGRGNRERGGPGQPYPGPGAGAGIRRHVRGRLRLRRLCGGLSHPQSAAGSLCRRGPERRLRHGVHRLRPKVRGRPDLAPGQQRHHVLLIAGGEPDPPGHVLLPPPGASNGPGFPPDPRKVGPHHPDDPDHVPFSAAGFFGGPGHGHPQHPGQILHPGVVLQFLQPGLRGGRSGPEPAGSKFGPQSHCGHGLGGPHRRPATVASATAPVVAGRFPAAMGPGLAG